MNKAIKNSCEKTKDAEKGMIKVRHLISFVSDTTYHDKAKFTMTELLLEDQYVHTFLQLKTTVIKKHLVGYVQVTMGFTKKSYAMTISTSSRPQYLRNMLPGPGQISTQKSTQKSTQTQQCNHIGMFHKVEGN